MIYGLTNKDTGEVRYVGRTQKTLRQRLASHKHDAVKRKENTPKDRWIQKIEKDQVEIIKLETGCESSEQAELWWMDYLEFLGCDLLNVIREPIGGKAGESGLEVTDEVKELMGTMPDRELGEKLGVSKTTIRKYRKRYNVKPFANTGGYDLPEKLVKQLGDKHDRKLAREFGYPRTTIKRKRKEKGISAKSQKINLPKECFKKMGKVSDGKLAKKYDVSRKTIENRRRKNGIEAYQR
jgi:transcriptional regulator with XRE-family HTH domain